MSEKKNFQYIAAGAAKGAADDASASEPTDAVPCGVVREPLVFGAAGRQVLGWMHHPSPATRQGRAVLLCQSVGFEYVNAYRVFVEFADRLAASGYPVLRFDYPGTGDSAGGQAAPSPLAEWIEAVDWAARELRHDSGCDELVAIGFRLGAALAALAHAHGAAIDRLVLWHPVAAGRQYVRELRAVAMAGAQPPASDGSLEVAGFAFAAELVAQLRAIDLTQASWPALRDALIIGRDDLQADDRVVDRMRAQGIPVTRQSHPGFLQMVCEPPDTRIPEQACAAIAQWLASPSVAKPGSAREFGQAERAELAIGDLREQTWLLAGERRIAGVYCSASDATTKRAPVLILNSGTAHRVGPAGLHVSIARALAKRGIPSLRFDLGGIGDSPALGSAVTNQVFPAGAVDDVFAVMDDLTQRLSCRRFVLLGHCSGAYHAFQAALQEQRSRIDEIVMINPLTLLGAVAMSAAPAETGVGRVAPWRARLKSASNYAVVRAAVGWLRRVRVGLRVALAGVAQRLGLRADGAAAVSLQAFFRRGVRLSVFVASRDPGMLRLRTEAGAAWALGLRRGLIDEYWIADANHVFSTEASRARLIESLCARLLATEHA
ncbi:alpha/beta hydrolase family protein [mine drainage metagenome]|uniref:Alpha/beta hydrolase family protein n=1 Tax=mine drainage metagenome TaxID=410659 RepID=A0A1J5R3B4_9ZZZZ